MLATIDETVLVYDKRQLDAWKSGDKALIPQFVKIPAIVGNQPGYHFGEMYALRWYHEREGWLGFSSYALGSQYAGSERRAEGRAKAEEVIPRSRLMKLRRLRSGEHLGTGEPDLFLYKTDGSFKFVEVKKQRDRLSAAQLSCIAQILAVLKCPVDIAYLRERSQDYTAKRYVFDLKTMKGSRLPDSA